MMQKKQELLISYIRANIAPILVDFISASDVKNAVILPANVDAKELNGYYDNNCYTPPIWYGKITQNRFLIIDKIDTISKEEQLKFCELLEHRKISTFDLPKRCVIIITANEINENKISEEIYSLVAHI